MRTNQYGMPMMGLGTFGRTGSAGMEAILTAFEIGYRHIDTAQTYDTERECGEAFRRSGLKRDEVFFTTKISTEHFGAGQLVSSLRASLDRLGLDQVDLTLLHWPSPRKEVPLPVYVEQIREAEALGLTRMIGVSNFTRALVDEAQALLGSTRIVNNQFEVHPYLQNDLLVRHCLDKNISVTCYLPIAQGRLSGDKTLKYIADSKACTIEQVALAYALARGLCVIPASANPERLRINFEAQEIELTPDEMSSIKAFDRGRRYIDFDWAPDWD